MRDTIVRIYTKVETTTYLVVRCGRCAREFTSCKLGFKTTTCPYCQRTVRLDTAGGLPEEQPANVVSLFRRPA